MKERQKLSVRSGMVALAALLVLTWNSFGVVRYVKQGGMGNGTSWTAAYGNPQQALAASAHDSGDQIWCAAGTYVPTSALTSDPRSKTFRMKRAVSLYGGFLGVTSETSLSQRNPIGNPTILSGDLNNNDSANFGDRGDNSYHVVYVRYFSDTNPNCGGFGQPPCNHTFITDSTVVDGFVIRGGAATGTGGETFFPTETWPSDGFGGGVLVVVASPVFQNCLITDNLAGPTPDSVLGGAAGAHVEGSGNLLDPGNPLPNSHPKFISTSFTHNKSNGHAGGLGNKHDFATMINCTFSHNVALIDGGGIKNSAIGGNANEIFVKNCSFSLNDAPEGSAIDTGEFTHVYNSIIWGNTPSNVAQIHVATGMPTTNSTVTYSDVQGGFTGTGNKNEDPQFVGAANDNLRIDGDSPCRNSGNNADIPADKYDVDNDGVTDGTPPNTEPTCDRDRLDRIRNTTIDMGAFENHASATCCADITGNGVANVDDLLAVINGWGNRGGPADIAPACGGDGRVNVDDLLLIVNSWTSEGNPCVTGAEAYDAGSFSSV